MENYQSKTIKEVIAEFPKIADILNEYNIGCVPCKVGTCLLTDIVKIHNLEPNDEYQLMQRITQIIDPTVEVKFPEVKHPPKVKEFKYAPPIKRLVEEHKLIKRVLFLIPSLIENLDLKTETGRGQVADTLFFIKNYADKFHHAKEEDILFNYTDKESDIIKAMYEDHTTGRNFVKNVLNGLEIRDYTLVKENLLGYMELLKEHIKKEDEILYPWIEKTLSMKQIGELNDKFNKADSIIGEAIPKKCFAITEAFEALFLTKKNGLV